MKEDLAEPLGLDLQIGISKEDEARHRVFEARIHLLKLPRFSIFFRKFFSTGEHLTSISTLRFQRP